MPPDRSWSISNCENTSSLIVSDLPSQSQLRRKLRPAGVLVALSYWSVNVPLSTGETLVKYVALARKGLKDRVQSLKRRVGAGS